MENLLGYHCPDCGGPVEVAREESAVTGPALLGCRRCDRAFPEADCEDRT